MAALGSLVTVGGRAREPAVPGPATAGLALIAAAAVLLAVTLHTLDRPSAAVAWGGIALAAYLAGLLCLTGTRYDGLGIIEWKTGPWMLAWYGIAFGLVTVTWSQPQYDILSEVALPNVLRALWLVAVAMTAWAIGYQAGPGRLLSARAARGMASLGRRLGPEVRSAASPWILYGIGSCARLATVATSGQLGYVGSSSVPAGGYTELLSALSLCAPIAVAAASLQVFREGKRGARKTLVILFAAEAVVGAASGGKESFVFAVLAAAIPFSAARRRLPKKTLAALVLFFLAVVIPFNQAYRAAVITSAGRLTPREGVAAAPGVLHDALAGKDPAALLGGSVAYLGQRVSEIGNPAIVLQRVPAQLPFASPAQLVTGPATGLIPRALWSGKPALTTGAQFSQEFFGISGTATPDTMPGGLYWHGGWVPLIVGMLLLGCAVRLLDETLDVRANPHAIVLLLLIFPVLVGAEEDWTSVLASVPATAFAWLAACFLAFGRQVHGPAAAGRVRHSSHQ
jgi:hypothetical protein